MTPIGSRRAYDVEASRYSPADLPSRHRVAPAKKRRLSAMKGISSSLKACSGLPALRASRSASSSALSSMTSASFSSAAWRSAGVVRDQPSKARRGAPPTRATPATRGGRGAGGPDRGGAAGAGGQRGVCELLAGGWVEDGLGVALAVDRGAVDEVLER